jgi:hypothetical protein
MNLSSGDKTEWQMKNTVPFLKKRRETGQEFAQKKGIAEKKRITSVK